MGKKKNKGKSSKSSKDASQSQTTQQQQQSQPTQLQQQQQSQSGQPLQQPAEPQPQPRPTEQVVTEVRRQPEQQQQPTHQATRDGAGHEVRQGTSGEGRGRGRVEGWGRGRGEAGFGRGRGQQYREAPRAWGPGPGVSQQPSPVASSVGSTSPPSREENMSPRGQPQQQQQQQHQQQQQQRQQQQQHRRQKPRPERHQGQQQRGDPPQEPGRTSGDSKSIGSLEQSVQKMHLKGAGDVPEIKPMEKSQFRKGGSMNIARKKITLLTNHFPLTLGKITRAIHYDVAIEPDKAKRLFPRAMELFRQAHYPERYPAFDGKKNLYSAYELCDGELSGKVTVVDEERPLEYTITIRAVTFVDLSLLDKYFQNIKTQVADKPMQALQCLDIILRSAPMLNCIPAGRSFFNIPKEKTFWLGDGAELYNGFYQSVVLGWKPFLNVDVAHKAFPAQMNVVDYINEISMNRANPRRPLEYRIFEMLEKHMRQLKVQYEVPRIPGSKRVHRVNGLGDPPSRATFVNKGAQITIEKYFATEKRAKLQYPNWPTLWVGSLQRADKILVPVEFCTILSGQAVNKKMTEMQTRNMIKEAATSAPTRLNKIREAMAKAQHNLSPHVQEFDLKVDGNPQQVDARILKPPTLQYAHNKADVKKGVWSGATFQTGVTISSWTIVNLDSYTNSTGLDNLEKHLCLSARKFGVNMMDATRQGYKFLYIDDNPKTLKGALIDFFKSTNFALTVVVVSGNSKNAYAYVKQVAELTVGRLTQCVKGRTVGKLNETTTDNIMLKINAKLNGVNHTLSLDCRPSCFEEPIVIMGADVTHPSPDARNIPSVAAVTCSYDPHGFKYIFSWRLQEPKLEIIKDLEEIVMEQLRYFRARNDCAPRRIVFFRDGVSDGQFTEVLSKELLAIQNACTRLNQNYKPRITFLVVQKRHHTRLFPTNDRDSEDRNLNVPAGTCVDTVITRPTNYDFYLVSHASIQGVAKPTKYFPLWDDADMSEDDIQQLTFYLCHLYARCNRSVSYPTPTYYAHLAAARGKVYIETEHINLENLRVHQQQLQVQDSIIRQLPMYFV